MKCHQSRVCAKSLCERFAAVWILLVGGSCAQAQYPGIPQPSGDPTRNCYNLSASVSALDVTFSWTRVDSSARCDTNSESPQLFLVYHLTPNGVETDPRPTPFGLALGGTVRVSLPGPGVYQPLLTGGIGSFNEGAPNEPLFVPLKLGPWEQSSMVIVGDPILWASPFFDHLPFASVLYPAQLDGQRLTFGVSLHGPTIGVFAQTTASGAHNFRSEILQGTPTKATVTLPNEFSFDAPIAVTLVDVATALSATWMIYDPIAARLAGRGSL